MFFIKKWRDANPYIINAYFLDIIVKLLLLIIKNILILYFFLYPYRAHVLIFFKRRVPCLFVPVSNPCQYPWFLIYPLLPRTHTRVEKRGRSMVRAAPQVSQITSSVLNDPSLHHWWKMTLAHIHGTIELHASWAYCISSLKYKWLHISCILLTKWS